MKSRFRAAVSVAALTTLAGCGSAHPVHHPAPRPSPPAWCTPQMAAAVNGSNPARLTPYLRDSPLIRTIYRQWAFVLAENSLIWHPWSITRLDNDAPVTTTGLPLGTIAALNKVCNP